MMNPVLWLQMTNMISYQGLVRTFPKTVKYIDIKPRDEYPLHLQVVYRGIDDGSGCYFAIVDDRMANYWTIVEDRLLYQDPPVEDVDAKAAELRKQLTPEVVMMVKDNCIDKQQ